MKLQKIRRILEAATLDLLYEVRRRFPEVACEIGHDDVPNAHVAYAGLWVAWPRKDGELVTITSGDIWHPEDTSRPSGGRDLVDGWEEVQQLIEECEAPLYQFRE